MKLKMQLANFQILKQMKNVKEVPKGVKMIQAPAIWENTQGEGVTIAILDTGCDTSHVELASQIIGGKNFTTDDKANPSIYQDYNGHGTHVAGTIAAALNDSGVVGVAPKANLLIVKVLDHQGSGEYDWIISGIEYAIDQQVDIISMSLGGPEDLPALHQVIKKAVVEHDISVVCAAGNEGDGKEQTREHSYPAFYNEVISVGAIDFNRQSSPFTNSNNQVDLVAPGEEITSTYLNGSYATLSGTSMAAPHVTGALALVKNLSTKQFERELTEVELYAQLIKRTLPLGFSTKLEGNGLIYLTLINNLPYSFKQLLLTAYTQLTQK
ncbi:intracellular serine protease [Paraliobacillus ryukyuensis]|uniref:Major intracellular serine protease n=1 Tax=Paraliobacillus ryukyuensis TaxID=200904 RepID=A0A366E9S1_9BACI|nr:S8 family peptidase [Paraliobacillus ryukyuensis]RBO98158.1 major intracellular serine protease [Paraliobacillus ryukyuensis]